MVRRRWTTPTKPEPLNLNEESSKPNLNFRLIKTSKNKCGICKMKEAGGHHRPDRVKRRLQTSVCDAASSDRTSVRETQQACRNDGKCQIITTNTVNTPITRAQIYGHASFSPSLLNTSMRGLHHEPVLLAIVGHEDDIAVGGPDEAGQLQVVLGTWGSWLHWWNLVGLNAAELGG